jgi:adenylate cyclase
MSYFSIRTRLVLLAILLLTILSATIALLTRELSRDSESLSDEARLVSVVKNADNANKHFGDLRYWLTEFASTLTPDSQHDAELAKAQLDLDLNAIMPVDPQGVAIIERDVNALWELVQKAAEAYYSRDDSAGGKAIMSEAQSHATSVNNEIEQIVARVEQKAVARRDAEIQDAKRAVDLSIAGGIIAFILALGVTALIVRSISVPLRQLVLSMNAITEERFDVSIPDATPDEIGGMTRALTMLRDSLIERNRLEGDRRRAETNAYRAQVQLGEAINAISEGFAFYDADDRLAVFNGRFRELYAGTNLDIKHGIRYETILRAAVETGILSAPSGNSESWIAERCERHRNPKGAFEQQRSDGTWLKISERHTEDGGIAAVLTDITALKDRERELGELVDRLKEAREVADKANRTKSSFLANMSHELRTPLNAIIGYSEILLEDAIDRGDKASMGDLEKIQAAGKHLLGLINDILDLSKIEAGRMDVYLEHVFLTRLVDEVKTIVEPMMKKNGNKLLIDCPQDIGSLQTDLTKLKQSIINLLSNAAKFTKDGTVTLRLAREMREGAPWIRFEVADSGIGMSDEQMSRLFQAFTQADSSTTRNFGGTGLGLTITRHFCAMLGGSIEVESKFGQGSTFTILLPDRATKAVAEEEPDSERPAVVHEPASGDIQVLVVDDDPAVHDVLAATLGKEGYQIAHAKDGVEALHMMRAHPPDIVTLDVMMPKMDGWSVLGVMKSEPQLAHIPVIMLTIVDHRNLGFSLGASEYMTKPIDRNRLVALIEKFAASRRDGTVLVIDDDPDVRAMVKATVDDVGMEATTVANGQAALDWLASHPQPVLVLLDLMMPKMDGFEFLERVRHNPNYVDLPIVVLTAKELTDNERSYLAERTLLVLSKSAQPISKLGFALAAIAGRNREMHGGAVTR